MPLQQSRPSDPRKLGAYTSEEREIVRRAQAHFTYEEFPDPESPSGTSYIYHPLCLDDTDRMNQATLESLRAHLKATLTDFGGGSESAGETFARMRLRTLTAVSWKLRSLAVLDSEVRDLMFGAGAAVIIPAWHVDVHGNVVDQDGRKKFDTEGSRLV
ncbi:hypothetical protein K504DRAFT_495564 [Pleomassaria siparia CBS 279.74]|uniref:Uncharacterized protein n=1 Tax=Pleomassaria siparia CBS 279.74 TaxID=1314801 RepID=A0A6G1JS48_9PLEO|nr:hypothetical protein K504DRAFT_495564 [Pleomassaria siparia CBS 279.74]